MKKFWKSDYFLMLISVLVAIFLWIYVVYDQNPIHETWLRDIPVSFINQPVDFESGKLIILDGGSETVDVKVRGKRSMLATVKASTVTCSVNMSDIKSAGDYILPVSVTIGVDGVELVTKSPYSITLSVDRVVTEERTVSVSVSGNPKSGYVLGSMNSDPGIVKLTGPQMIISSVASAGVLVDVSDADADIAGLYKIKLYDADGKEITDSRIGKNIEYCDIKCPVLSSREFTVNPILSSETNSEGNPVSVKSVNPEKITLIGRTEELDRIDGIYTMSIDPADIYDTVNMDVYLDLSQLTDGISVMDDIKSVKIEINADKADDTQTGDAGENPDGGQDGENQNAE